VQSLAEKRYASKVGMGRLKGRVLVISAVFGLMALLLWRRRMPSPVILFDVNETLLDTRALDSYFERIFGSPAARERWFKELESLALTSIVTGVYQDFSALAEAALHMSAEKDGITLSAQDPTELLERLTMLPPYPDVAPALARLKNEGFRLAALTNGTIASTGKQLNHARLGGFFEKVLSADEVQCHKPGPAPYRMAAERLHVTTKEMCLVAAHTWDIAGAQAAGLKTAFVARPRKTLNPTGTKPDLKADDLLELTEHILCLRHA
jgi:2-haloacid dehalogenase